MINRRNFLGSSVGFPAILKARPQDRPNVLWILAEDIGHQQSCYGHPLVKTPNIDTIGRDGVRFNRAFSTAPVCSASRSAFNTGVYQTTSGTHNHRSHRRDGYQLPKDVHLITDRLRERGYYTANVSEFAPGISGSGKTDFNFTAPRPFDGTHWNQRKSGQPFFAQVNFMEPHKGPAFIEARKQKSLINPAAVTLPPYFPDHPVVRDEVANFLDAVQLLDYKVGALLEILKKDGLLDNTAIFFMGDNGTCLIRGKQWLYDKGILIPLLARFPGELKAGGVRNDMVLSLDVSAQTLIWAGVSLPELFHGQPLFGKTKPREHIVAARDRCDMTVDRIRCVRDRRYKYIRNFMPDRPYTQHNEYIEQQYPTLAVMKKLYLDGKLNKVQSLFMQPRKPEVELYDTQADPHEIRNLSGLPEHRERIRQFELRLDRWIDESNDQGRFPESPEAAAI